MNSASSLSSSASSHLVGPRLLRRHYGGSPVSSRRSPAIMRVSGSCSSTTEKERGSRYYYSGGFAAAAGVAAGSLYEMLGLKAGATAEEIKTAYRKLARACHPDAVAADRKGDSAEEFIKIHAAYATLSDPVKRADYDRRMISSTLRWSSPSSSSVYNYATPSARSSSSSRFSRRTWETDQCW